MWPKLLLLLSMVGSVIAAEPRDISATLEGIRAKYRLPACASAVIENGHVTAIGATGIRRVGRAVRVTSEDSWHIGSCTKSMTATLIGVLVDSGKLRWNTPVSDVFPEMICDSRWKRVTVWDLVTQRGGVRELSHAQWRALDSAGGVSRDQRTNFARALLTRPPLRPPGKFAYSNEGYGLLGAIIEHASGESYEDFLYERIFVPLGLKTADFGPPAKPGSLDQPWGHWSDNGRLIPVDPTPKNEFPPALAPAGCVHMSLEDFARYAWWLSSGEPRIVKPETFARLQTPPKGSKYAGGRWKSDLPGIGGEGVCHTGDLGGFFAIFYAGRSCACVSVFNVEGDGLEWLGDVISAAALKAAQ
jgi:CubicO group peptidase (beta-lactamase class C family)